MQHPPRERTHENALYQPLYQEWNFPVASRKLSETPTRKRVRGFPLSVIRVSGAAARKPEKDAVRLIFDLSERVPPEPEVSENTMIIGVFGCGKAAPWSQTATGSKGRVRPPGAGRVHACGLEAAQAGANCIPAGRRLLLVGVGTFQLKGAI